MGDQNISSKLGERPPRSAHVVRTTLPSDLNFLASVPKLGVVSKNTSQWGLHMLEM